MRHMHALPNSANNQCPLTTNLVTCETRSLFFLFAIYLGLPHAL
jgi:hypothetical protein